MESHKELLKRIAIENKVPMKDVFPQTLIFGETILLFDTDGNLVGEDVDGFYLSKPDSM